VTVLGTVVVLVVDFDVDVVVLVDVEVVVVETVGVVEEVEEVVVVVVPGAMYSKGVVAVAPLESVADTTYVPVTHDGVPPIEVM
jgi:hypothetical protein